RRPGPSAGGCARERPRGAGTTGRGAPGRGRAALRTPPPPSPMDPTLEQLRRLRSEEPRVALATLVATRGTSPRREGAKMWVGEGGRILGAVTLGGCVDARVIGESEQVLSSGRAHLLSVDLGEAEAWGLGLTCSGALDVLIEPLDLAEDAAGVLSAYRRVEEEVRAGRWA